MTYIVGRGDWVMLMGLEMMDETLFKVGDIAKITFVGTAGEQILVYAVFPRILTGPYATFCNFESEGHVMLAEEFISVEEALERGLMTTKKLTRWQNKLDEIAKRSEGCEE